MPSSLWPWFPTCATMPVRFCIACMRRTSSTVSAIGFST